jgi:hypothetical protein
MRHLRLALIACCIGPALAAVLAGRAEAKPPAGIDIGFQVGYDGYVQEGRINPVAVVLKNASADKNLSGELALRYNDVEYVTPLELPTPSQKRIYLYFPCDNGPPYLTLTVRTKEYTEEFDLSSYFKPIQSADTSIVVLTDQPGSLGVLNQLKTVRLHRDLYETETSSIGSSTTYVSYFKPDQVDPTPRFFDRADMIVLGDIDYRQVTPELAETLKACAAGGASVVFSLGLNGAAVSSSQLADLCPLRAAGTVQLSDLGEFGQRYGISAAAVPATFATGSVAAGATVLDSAGAYPALVRSQWGSGTVSALAFDFTAVPFKQNPQLGELFLDTALSVPQNVEVRNWFVHPEPVAKLLLDLTEAHPMPPQFVLLFIVAYVVLIGPLNFLVLRQLKRQTLVWTTIPLLILGFGYGGLETGNITRGSDNVTSVFEELHVYPRASYVPYQSVTQVFTAERTHYSLEVPDASAFLYADIPQENTVPFGGSGGASQFRGLTGSKLDMTSQPLVTTTQGKWTEKAYMFQGYAKLPMTVECDLHGERQKHGLTGLDGRFSLDLPFDLRDCYLYLGEGSREVGDLAGKGDYSIADLKSIGSAGSAFEKGNYLYADRNQLAKAQQQASKLGLDYRDEALLVGFTDQVPVNAEFKHRHKQHALTMVVVHLPVQPRFDPSAPSAVRTLISGGKGFTVEDPSWNGYGDRRQQQLALEQDGEVDLTLKLLGGADQASRFTVTLSPQLDRGQPVKNAASVLSVYGWSGAGWRPLRLNPDSADIDAALGDLPDADHVVKLRLVSQVDKLRLELPEAETYGGVHQRPSP